MTGNIRSELFAQYRKTHEQFLGEDESCKLAWFHRYFRDHYAGYLQDLPRSATILELGCNRGFLLKALHDYGFTNLHGVDLSPEDLEFASGLGIGAVLQRADIFDYLAENPGTFDAIILKAVLEHIPKDSILRLLQLIRKSLAPAGRVLVDVPNMDWFFASHERHMDFTHEVGFTKESLGQVLRLEFGSVDVHPCDHSPANSDLGRMRQRAARYLIGKLLSWADAEGASNPIWCRSILAVARA